MTRANGGFDYQPDAGLIVVDVQNDFADPAGSLYVEGSADIVADIDAEIAAAADGGSFVVYTQDWHPPVTPHFAKDGGIWPVHCVRDSWGAQIHPRLRIAGPTVHTGVGTEDGYSGFTEHDAADPEAPVTSTGLEELLADHGVRRLVVIGLAGDYCVRATALDAVRLGYPVTAPWSLTRSVNLEPGDGDAARAELEAAGVLVTS